FQIYTQVTIKTVAVIGFNKGNTILKNIPIVLAPSIRAASSNSLGTVDRIKLVYKNIANGLKDATLFNTAIVRVFIIPMSTTNLYKGTKAVNGGTTMIAIIKANTNLFNFVCRSANGQAAIEPSTINNRPAKKVIIIEFIKAVPKLACSQASAKLDHSISIGNAHFELKSPFSFREEVTST